MTDYHNCIKTLSDTLATAGRPAEPHELVYYTLGGQSPDYEPDVLPLKDLHHLLLPQRTTETLANQLASLDLWSTTSTANVASRAGSSQNHGRGAAISPRIDNPCPQCHNAQCTQLLSSV